MYITPVASSCTIWVVYIVATAGPAITLGDLVTGGTSMGTGEGGLLISQATTSLKPGGGATSGLGSGDPRDDVKSDFSSVALLHSLACWCWALLPPELWLWWCCLNLPRVGGVCPVGVTSQAGCSTCIQPGKLVHGTSLLSPFSCCIEGCLAHQLAPWQWPSKWLVQQWAPLQGLLKWPVC